jgi:hypothetical protein
MRWILVYEIYGQIVHFFEITPTAGRILVDRVQETIGYSRLLGSLRKSCRVGSLHTI